MTFAQFWPEYVRAHSRAATRVAHLIGTLTGCCGGGDCRAPLVVDCPCLSAHLFYTELYKPTRSAVGRQVFLLSILRFTRTDLLRSKAKVGGPSLPLFFKPTYLFKN